MRRDCQRIVFNNADRALLSDCPSALGDVARLFPCRSVWIWTTD